MTTDTPDEQPGALWRENTTTHCDVCGERTGTLTAIETWAPHHTHLCDACIDAAVALRTKEIEEAIR